VGERINPGPITVMLTDEERTTCMAALATFAQTMHGVVLDGMPDLAAPAWSALAKLAERSDVREMFGERRPTMADTARLLVECEMEMALARTYTEARQPDDFEDRRPTHDW
jgi:hypothetical protein